MEEIWKDIDGYEGHYKVSNLGNIKSLNFGGTGKERIMRLGVGTKGYLKVKLYINSYAKTFDVHRLVAKAFINNPSNKKEVNHIDGCKTNNNANNLEWATRKENMRHAVDTGLMANRNRICGSKHHWAKLCEEDVVKIRNLYNNNDVSQHKLAKIYNIDVMAINRIIHRKSWKHI